MKSNYEIRKVPHFLVEADLNLTEIWKKMEAAVTFNEFVALALAFTNFYDAANEAMEAEGAD
jgi:hypothetical protein